MQNAGNYVNFMLVVTFYVRFNSKKRKLSITRTIFTFSQKFVLSNAPITRTFANSNYFHGPLEVRVIGIIRGENEKTWKIEVICFWDDPLP